jgi:hypothetical protein
MKKGFWRFSFVIILLLALTAVACDDTVFYEPAEHIPAEEAPEHIDTYNGQQGAEEGPVQAGAQTETPAHYADIFSSGRARGEYLEDLDHLYSVLTANFPFFGVIYRSLGMDLHGLYHETRQHIEDIRDIPSDEYFANIINSRFISQARGTGHFNMLTEDFLRLHIQVFSNQVAQGSDQFLYFLHEIDNYATRALHGLTDEDFAPPIPGRDSFVYATASDNLQTSIIEPGRIAYVNILQMNHATVRLDRAKLLNFYRYIADFDHLIVDIRQNGGGDSRFFPYLVIAPNIDRPLEYYFYMLLMDGEHNRRLLAPWFEDWWDGVTEYPVFQPIHDDLLERLTYLDAADAEMLDLYWTYRGIIHPSQGEAIFGGKIWLLVSGTNFSASEQAAAIAKQTGFATLVGQTTGGDGIGINPLVLALPNTGVIVRYSSVYGTDPLGHNNQEFGTNPHIFNRPGRDALETVLEIIAESY